MCGRYALYGPISRHRKNKPVDDLPDWYPSLVDAINVRVMRFNVAPTDVMPIVGVNREGGISIRELRRGLVPYWAKDVKIGYKAINARAETINEKPMFRDAFKRRRCLVPASGYFEWKPEGAAKQPYFIHDTDSELLMFAGLWEIWRETKESEPLYTYTIVTGPPGVVSGDIHDRAPVILAEGAWEAWLTGEVADAAEVLEAAQEPQLRYYTVSKAVGSPKNDSPELVQPINAYVSLAEVLRCLRELSDADYQERLWLGRIAGKMGSLTEAICQLFDDTGLGDALEHGRTGFAPELDDDLRALGRQLDSIDTNRSLEDILADPRMTLIRDSAARVLRLIEAP